MRGTTEEGLAGGGGTVLDRPLRSLCRGVRRRRLGRLLLAQSTNSYPLGDYLDRNNRQGAWHLIVPLQIDVVAGLQVGAIHQLLGQGDLTVVCDLTRAMRHVHMTQTTNICSLCAGTDMASPQQELGGAWTWVTDSCHCYVC